jgi:hypothetical protein
MKTEQGFTVTEVLVATTLALIVMAGTLGSLNDALGLNEKTMLMADLGQNMRAGLNFLIQDYMNAGWGIPIGGIPIPSGAGAATVVRPGPPAANYTFGNSVTIAAVNTGEQMGPAGNGRLTDMVNILYADSVLALNQTPLAAIAPDGSSVTVDVSIPITGIPNAIRAGDLIAFSNALGNAIQYVTAVNGQVITFGAGDPMRLNQRNAPQGSIMNLQNAGVFPPTTATRVWLITYYLDTATDPLMPRLIRQVNNNRGNAVALVLEDLQLSYDLVDGVTNPTNVKTPTAPNSPNQIRKVNILLFGRSSDRVKNTNDYLRRTMTTQVSLRSLAFIDRYI